jgi:hypothetical protein
MTVTPVLSKKNNTRIKMPATVIITFIIIYFFQSNNLYNNKTIYLILLCGHGPLSMFFKQDVSGVGTTPVMRWITKVAHNEKHSTRIHFPLWPKRDY